MWLEMFLIHGLQCSQSRFVQIFVWSFTMHTLLFKRLWRNPFWTSMTGSLFGASNDLKVQLWDKTCTSYFEQKLSWAGKSEKFCSAIRGSTVVEEFDLNINPERYSMLLHWVHILGCRLHVRLKSWDSRAAWDLMWATSTDHFMHHLSHH